MDNLAEGYGGIVKLKDIFGVGPEGQCRLDSCLLTPYVLLPAIRRRCSTSPIQSRYIPS